MTPKPHRIHFMGMAGSATAGIATLTQSMGYEVTGCDQIAQTYYSSLLKKANLQLLEGHNPEHLKGVDLVAVSPAVLTNNPNHPEVLEAKKRGILMTWQEFMGRYLQQNKQVIAVAGTHGKSTTTALAGLVLEAAGLDPIVEVGAPVPAWGASVRPGKSAYFVCEADEYNNNFLYYSPSYLIINNIEMDHPEFFTDFSQVLLSFVTFVQKLVLPRVLIVNEESLGVSQLLTQLSPWLSENKIKLIGYYQHRPLKRHFDLHYQYQIAEQNNDITPYLVNKNERYQLQIPGVHNIANSMGVVCLAKELGVSQDVLTTTLASFTGIGRRIEKIASIKGIEIYDDYAHHPTAIKATITALKQKYPQNRLWAILEPHQYSRLKLMWSDFVQSFAQADKVIITTTYAGREKNTSGIKEQSLAQAIGKKAQFIADPHKLSDLVCHDCLRGDIIIVMGAGNSYLIAREIVNKLIKT